MELFFWIFLSVTFLFWLAGWYLCARLRKVPRLEPGAPKPNVKISIIIPARNEESNLKALLGSVNAQEFSPHEVIVVNDQSEDGTVAVAEEHGAKVINGKSLPDGWLGKPWACAQGAMAAEGDWFLFLDADTWLEPEALLRIGHLAREKDSVFSFCPYHRVRRPYEQLSSFFNVIMLLGTNAFTAKADEEKEVRLFGQSLFLSRDHYALVKGHELVKGEVLENFALSRHFSEKGITCRSYAGKGTISMRMFPGGFRELVASWGKGFVKGAGQVPREALVGVSLWLSGLIMSVIALTFLPQASDAVAWCVYGMYFLSVVQSWYLFRVVGTFWGIGAVLFPVGLFFYQWLFFVSARRRKRGETIQWKGRNVD